MNEEQLIKTLQDYFTKEELEFVISKKIGSFGSAKAIIERKLIIEMSHILSGELIIEGTLEQLKKLERQGSIME